MSRVAVDARMLHSAGIGRYLRQLLPGVFSGMGERRTLLGDVAAMSAEGLDRLPGVELIGAASPIYSLAEQVELFRLTPADADLFWAPHYNIPLLRRGKLLVTVHDVLHLARPEFVGGLHRRAYARAMFGVLRAKADAILCDSRFTADELMRHGGVGADRVTVVYPGLEKRWHEPFTAEAVHPRPFLLYTGSVKPHKNLLRLLEAFEVLSSEIPHDLVIAGKKEGLLTSDDVLLERARRLGGRVHLPGEVSDPTLHAYMAQADMLVFPSLYEGFGYPPLEAMAVGCPVVASRAASIPEVCGDSVVYFDPQDVGQLISAIRRVLSDSGLREELRERGREQARRYPPEKCAAETRQVIERVMGAW